MKERRREERERETLETVFFFRDRCEQFFRLHFLHFFPPVFSFSLSGARLARATASSLFSVSLPPCSKKAAAKKAPYKEKQRARNGRRSSKEQRSGRCRKAFLFLFLLHFSSPPPPGPRTRRAQGLGALEDALRARRAVRADQGEFGKERELKRKKNLVDAERRRMVAV